QAVGVHRAGVHADALLRIAGVAGRAGGDLGDAPLERGVADLGGVAAIAVRLAELARVGRAGVGDPAGALARAAELLGPGGGVAAGQRGGAKPRESVAEPGGASLVAGADAAPLGAVAAEIHRTFRVARTGVGRARVGLPAAAGGTRRRGEKAGEAAERERPEHAHAYRAPAGRVNQPACGLRSAGSPFLPALRQLLLRRPGRARALVAGEHLVEKEHRVLAIALRLERHPDLEQRVGRLLGRLPA